MSGMNSTSSVGHSIPVSGAAARQWMDDARYLAYPDRPPESDEAVKSAVRLIKHLTSFLWRAAREDVSTAFPGVDSDGTFQVAWSLPGICFDLSQLCELLGRRYHEFAREEALQLRGNLGAGLHPEVSRVEAAGIVVSVAEAYTAISNDLDAVYNALSAIGSATGRISMEADK